MPTADELLAMLRYGGRIVLATGLPRSAVRQALRCGRVHQDADGHRYVYLPGEGRANNPESIEEA